jgi:glycosyltransferase involved in cell wall biosynthesis
MQIAIDIRPLLEPEQSGVGVYLTRLLEAMLPLASNHEVFLFLNHYGKAPVALDRWRNSSARLQWFRWPNKLLNAGFYFIRQPKLDRLFGEMDVVWMPNLNFIALSSRAKLVVTCHDLSFELYPEFFSLKHRLWHRLINPSALYHRADHVIANSENTKKDLVRHYHLPGEKISMIYPGIDQPKDPIELAEKARVRSLYQLPSSYLLHVGTIEPRKNVESLLQAFHLLARRHHDLHFVLVGKMGGKSRLIRTLRQMIPEPHRIHFLGYVPARHLRGIYANARATVFPSYYEGFGFPPLESMVAGTPVITSPHSSLSEVGGDAVLYADPYNVAEIAAVLDELLTSPALAEALRQRGHARVTQFSWERTARHTLRCLEDVLHSSHRSSLDIMS